MTNKEQSIHCPLCGNEVPPGVSKCPVCATELDKVISRRSSSPQRGADYLHRGIPSVVLPKQKLSCPQCALEISGTEEKCPRCGIPLATERQMLECPECGTLTPPGSQVCPSCGIGFEEEESEPPAPPPPEEMPPAPEPVLEVVTPIPLPAPVMVQGLVNGRGAINGTGLSGSRGAVNGTGLVNGTGVTTEALGRIAQTPSAGKRQFMLLRKWQFLAVLIVLALVIPTFVYLSYAQSPGSSIDGDFGEWDDIDKYSMQALADTPSLAVEEWAVKTDADGLYLYVLTQGQLMSSSEVHSFYLFVDSDNDAETGYAVSNVGAEYMLQLNGWDGDVRSSSLSEYTSANDPYDWSSWLGVSSLESAIESNQLEARAMMPAAIGDEARYLLLAQDNMPDQSASVSYPVPETGGILVIKVEEGTGISTSGVIQAASGVVLMRLVLTCEGNGGTIDSIIPSVTGASISSSLENIAVEVGVPMIKNVVVDSTLASPSDLVTGSVSESLVVSTFSDVYIEGTGVSAYVSAPPSSIEIDGAFGDWVGKTTYDTDSVANENIDIDGVGELNTTASSFFYVSVKGEMCSGSFVPAFSGKPSGGGGVVTPTRKTGEDVLKVFIDADLASSTGQVVSVASKVIGADYMIEIHGLNGNIVSKAVMAYSAGSWSAQPEKVVSAAKDYQQMEIGIIAAYISGSSSIDFIIETTDWQGAKDLATTTPSGTRAFVSALPSDPGFDRWIIDGSATAWTATALSYQRKLFFDGVSFWSFYFDGTDTVCRYSADNGNTWTLYGSVFKTTGVNETSIWWDSSSSVVYAVGDATATDSRNVFVQRGSVVPATHTITWALSDSTCSVSSTPWHSKNSFISKDPSGYLWIMSVNRTQGGANPRYDLSAFSSNAADAITSWTSRGGVLAVDDPDDNLPGTILPTGTGRDMWAVYGYGGNVSARKHTGTWSTETMIYSIGNENPENTHNAPPCAVVDSRGVIHVVYGNGHEQSPISKPRIYYVYNRGSAWSVPYRLEATANNLGNKYPTISLDSASGNVYAIWVQVDTAGIPITLVGKVNQSGTWTALTFDPQTTAQKHFLNSVYSSPTAHYICWQWTQNTTAPRQIVFDRIPEFQTVIVPVLGLIVVIGMFARMRRKGE